MGTIRTPWKTRQECPKRTAWTGPVCSIVLDERWRPVLYWMHQARRNLVLLTPFQRPTVGTFAKLPVRSNPIITSLVEFVAIEGTMLRACGLDCLGGTPLL